MSFQISPGVNVSEIDLTTVVPAVATTEAGIGGVFRWGPVNKTLLVSSEDELRRRYGKPTNLNGETFFSAASFLAYSDSLFVSRAWHTSGKSFEESADIVSGNAVISSVNSSANVTVGDAVYGVGVPEGTTVTDVTDLANGEVTISSAPTANGTGTNLQFFDADYMFNAVANASGTPLLSSHIVENEDDYDSASGSFESSVEFVARYPGKLGNSLKVSVCDSASAFQSNVDLTSFDSANTTEETIEFTVGSNTATISMSNTAAGDANSSAAAVTSAVADLSVGDMIRVGNTSIGTQYLKITAIGDVTKTETGDPASETGEATVSISLLDRYTLSTDYSSATVQRYWEYWNDVDIAPGQSTFQQLQGNTSASDELHIVVEDEDGLFTGTPGTILEVFEGLSRATDAKTEDGGTNYFKSVLNNTSQYVWYANDISGAASNTAADLTSSTNDAPYTQSFVGGRDTLSEANIAMGDLLAAYDLFRNPEEIDVSLLINGKSRGGVAGEQNGNYLIDNICNTRRDCVAFISPDKDDVVGNNVDPAQDVVDFRDQLRSSSYAVLDSGYKYMYDKYNDVYRWIPLNGDIAGLCAFTDDIRDAWWSPGGFNRGQIKNAIKLAWNPDERADRDLLYKNGVNPVVKFRNQGIVLYGDKTLLSKPSAFDRINVRRLFIVLEKAIATAAKSTLFEFNDEFTRAQFVNLVVPYLRDVQGRRGITDFRVICDETNNTGEVIDRNEFVGDIYIKPTRAINFIQLNFIAVRSGVEFSEVIGNF